MSDWFMICSFALKKQAVHMQKFLVFTISLTVFTAFPSCSNLKSDGRDSLFSMRESLCCSQKSSKSPGLGIRVQ